MQVGLFLFQIFRSQQHREAKTPKISWWVSADRAGGPVSTGSTWTDSTDTTRPAVVSLVEFSGICAWDRPKLDTTSLLVLLTTANRKMWHFSAACQWHFSLGVFFFNIPLFGSRRLQFKSHSEAQELSQSLCLFLFFWIKSLWDKEVVWTLYWVPN